MGTINYSVLRNELVRDPIELGYNGMTPEEIVILINDKQFSESALFDENGVQVFYSASKTFTSTIYGGTTIPMAGAAAKPPYTKQIKRSRAELLFGYDVIITVDDIDLAR